MQIEVHQKVFVSIPTVGGNCEGCAFVDNLPGCVAALNQEDCGTDEAGIHWVLKDAQ